jgi:hypothetical protein
MKPTTKAIVVGVGILLVYEVVAAFYPDLWTISRWVWNYTLDAGAQGAPWVALMGILMGHFTMGRRVKPDGVNLSRLFTALIIAIEVVAGLVLKVPSPAKFFYGLVGYHFASFIYGYVAGGLIWTRGLIKNE